MLNYETEEGDASSALQRFRLGFAAGVRAAAFRLLPPPANANNLSASARSPNATVYSHETKRTTQCVAQYAHDGDGSQLRHTPFQLCHIATSIKFDFFRRLFWASFFHLLQSPRGKQNNIRCKISCGVA